MLVGCSNTNDEYDNSLIKLLLCYDDDAMNTLILSISKYKFGLVTMITIVIMTMTTTTLLVTVAVDLKNIIEFPRYHS